MNTIISLLISLVISTISPQAKPVASIPFTVEKNSIYFYGKVNETDSIRFLFDTGADGSVLTEKAMKKLKLRLDGTSKNLGSNGTNDFETSSGNQVVLGGILKKNVTLTIIPYGEVNFSGVFGTDLMKGHIVEIDYHKQVLNFYKEDDPEINYTGYTKMSLGPSANYPTTLKSTLLIGDKKYSGLFGLDTGADDVLTISSPYSRKNGLVDKMVKIGSAGFQGSDGSEYEMPIVLCPEIQFAAMHLYRLPISLSVASEGIDSSDKIDGFFGNAFLKKFNIILDYKKKAVYFRLNKNLYTEFY